MMEVGVLTQPSRKASTCPTPHFAHPALTTFVRPDELGPEVTCRRLESARAVLACRAAGRDRWCEGAARGTVVRRLAHAPRSGVPRPWRHGSPVSVHRVRPRVASGRAPCGRAQRPLGSALERIVVQHLSVARLDPRRGREDDPLLQARWILHTGAKLLTDKQRRWVEGTLLDQRHGRHRYFNRAQSKAG